jgi:sugar O-acyltransferase (sialic acid O-acetyltransferase NeuD family)
MGKQKIVIYGAGGHGKMVADAAIAQGEYEVTGFIDDSATGSVMDLPVLGSEIPEGIDGAIVGVGDPLVRSKLQKKVQDAGLTIISVVHPTATVCSGVVFGEGTVIMPQAVVGVDTVLGDGCIINTDATVDHDSTIGDFAHISPGAHLAGEVSIGANTQVGIGSSVKEGVKIGSNSIIGAGSTVVSDIEDGCTAFGTPAKKVSENT